MPVPNGNAGGTQQVTQEQVADDFDRITATYEDDIDRAIAFAGMEHAFYVDVKRDHLLRLTREHFGAEAGLDVLDLGCGLGAYHAGLENRFHELHGVDVSAASIDLAAQRHPAVHYLSYDGATLPYPDGRFDVVFTICVMHHVPPFQWEGFLREMRRVLKPGGLALVFEHNPYNPATRYIVKSCAMDKDAVLLRPAKLRRLFEAARFSEIVTRSILSVPPRGRFLTRLDWLSGPLTLGAQYYLRGVKPQRG